MNTVSLYDYNNISDFERRFLPDGFKGNVYNMSYKWLEIIPANEDIIKILEIGVYHGANICSLTKTYAIHNNSEIHCIDPWLNYNEYNEYKTEQTTNYSLFINNISKLSSTDLHKIYMYRGLSENIIPQFENESFDMIYIDGNHLPKFVLEDAVLSFKKLKKGGWMIFDDLQDKKVNGAVTAFLNIYSEYFENHQIKNAQLFIKKR